MDPTAQLANALSRLVQSQTPAALPPQLVTARFVTVGLAAAKIGLTEKAIRRKVEDGVWRETVEWRRAPDGHVMIDMHAVERWIESCPSARRSARTARPVRRPAKGLTRSMRLSPAPVGGLALRHLAAGADSNEPVRAAD